jgi:ethanolamine utilization protein EutA
MIVEWRAEPTDTLDIGQSPDVLVLRSVGVDIGSATSHLTYSRITLRRDGLALSSRYEVVAREELYRSEVMLTPYLDEALIDAETVERYFSSEYERAASIHGEADTGVVIVTGEAANRANAPALAKTLSDHVGSTLCVAAGPHYEALLAAHGSGAVEASLSGQRILNIDIGGGTTKLSLIQGGNIVSTAALSVGARLLAVGDDGRVSRMEPPLTGMLEHLGENIAVGDRIADVLRHRVADLEAELLVGVLGGPLSDGAGTLLSTLWVTDPFPESMLADIDGVTYSGGVSEYILGRSDRDYGDLGKFLGEHLREELQAPGWWPCVADSKGIRATVLGAGQHSVEVSGITSFVTVDALPLGGLKIIPATTDGISVSDLSEGREIYDLDAVGGTPCYALTLTGDIDYAALKNVGQELVRNARVDEPLVVMVDTDVAFALGRIIQQELGWDGRLVILDCVAAGDLDYVDIGRPIGFVDAIPVTLKSLTFVTRGSHD